MPARFQDTVTVEQPPGGGAPSTSGKRAPTSSGNQTAQTLLPSKVSDKVREETPTNQRKCPLHEATFPSVINLLIDIRAQLCKMKTSREPALIKERACNQLGNAIHHLEEMKANMEQKASAQLNKEANQRMDDMEKNIQSIEQAMQQMSEMVTETSQTMGQYFKEAKAQPGNQNSTYAEKVTAVQINQGRTTINNGHQNMPEKTHQHREKLRKLRQETEVVLTTKGMSKEQHRKIKAIEHNEIREICQKAIE